jgi:hypothetical protein
MNIGQGYICSYRGCCNSVIMYEVGADVYCSGVHSYRRCCNSVIMSEVGNDV